MTEDDASQSGQSQDAHPTSGETANDPRAVAEESVDPMPLAAYRLGYLSIGVWFWHEVFWNLADEESTWSNVPLALSRLRSAMGVLRAEIHPNVFDELERAAVDFGLKASGLTDPSRTSPVIDPDAYRPRLAPFKAEWEILRSLADRALAGACGFRSLHDLGSALADFRLWLWDWGPGSIFSDADLERHDRWLDAGGKDSLPDVRPLVRAAMRLPAAIVARIPCIESLVKLSPLLENAGPERYFKALLDRHPELARRFEPGNQLDHAIISAMADGLDDAIQGGLAMSDSELKSTLPLHDERLLSWNKNDTGELKYANVVIRKLATQATRARPVLDQFQSKNWATTVPNPFVEPGYAVRLKDALRTLNKDLTVIRFRPSEGNSVSYGWIEYI